jgi:hypothetical protein
MQRSVHEHYDNVISSRLDQNSTEADADADIVENAEIFNESLSVDRILIGPLQPTLR